MKEIDWSKKLKTGEYLRTWNGYTPFVLGCTSYSQNIGIGEKKFFNCVGEFNGMGNVEWWIKEELDKLSQQDLYELKSICEYKTYLDNFITLDLVVKITNFFGCKPFHVYRTNHKNIINFCNQINDFYEKILIGSQGCLDEMTIEFKQKQNPFKIMSFEEFKTNNKRK